MQIVHGSIPAAAQTSSSLAVASAAGRDNSFDLGWLFYRGALTGAEAADFDDSAWRHLNVPHDWSIEDLPNAIPQDTRSTSDPSAFAFYGQTSTPANVPTTVGPFDPTASAGQGATGYTVSGEGWYRKHFTADSSLGNHLEVRFDGVYQNADFWINGTHLGFHPYGYTSFSYDLTPYLNSRGSNVLAVHVNNSGQTSRWYSGSGIIRHTWLTTTNTVRVPTWGVRITTPTVNESSATVHANVSVTALTESLSSGHAVQVRVTLLDPQGNAAAAATTAQQIITSGQTLLFIVDLTLSHPALWSLESPNLYQARADVIGDNNQAVDSSTTTFGVRSIVMNGTDGFLLNGKPVKMRGLCLHSDLGLLGAASYDRAEVRRVEILKAAGFNAIRTAHNPPAPAMLEACDRLGMLVYEEAFDMWDEAKNPDDYHLYFSQYGSADIASMVLRDYNHPSIVLWSIGNEIYDFSYDSGGFPTFTNNGDALAQALAATIRSLDTSRPITEGGWSGNGLLLTQNRTVNDVRWNFLDVGDTHYQHDYNGLRPAHPDRAMLQSESLPSSVYEDWTLVTGSSYAIGDFTWAGWDYLGETGLGKPSLVPAGTPPANTLLQDLTGPNTIPSPPYPWFQSYCGDIDLIGEHKPQWRWRTVVWGDSPVEMAVERPVAPAGQEQHAYTWGYYDELQSWTWDVPAGQTLRVRVYTSGDMVTLLLNGQQVGVNLLSAADRMATTFDVPYQPGTLTAVASKAGVEIGRKTFATVGVSAALRLVPDTNQLGTDRNDLAFLRVDVVDAQGKLVPDAVARVSVTIQGNGELAGTANANPHNADSFQQPNRYTFHGQALAAVRSNGVASSIEVTVASPGLSSATQTLQVINPGVFSAFFTGQIAVGNGVYYLPFTNGNDFGYYSFLSDPAYLYHFDLGFEYLFDANDGQSGVYFYDFSSNTFFYTSPNFPFPYLYDFTLNTVVYYYSDPNDPTRYNTAGIRYFYRFDTGMIFSK